MMFLERTTGDSPATSVGFKQLPITAMIGRSGEYREIIVELLAQCRLRVVQNLPQRLHGLVGLRLELLGLRHLPFKAFQVQGLNVQILKAAQIVLEFFQ